MTVTCEHCQKRQQELRTNNQRADERYEVGNPAKPSMGHAMYFTREGRTALCIAKRK